jgi:aryl-phospho-beta-D-glucosidase BglC (GH1 family)
MRKVVLMLTVILPVIFLCSSYSETIISIEPEKQFVFYYDFSNKITNLPVPTARRLPSTWKGFNLLNMFYLNGGTHDRPFVEDEFRMIAELGFNFVRIPIDYRILIRSNNWNNIDERAFQRIDRALEFGIKYDIHICLNLHRAPGFTVASPPEVTDLWTQEEPQQAFARMWAFFAERYKNIPNEYLSFNFVNEPPDMDEAVYASVIKKAADAIWAQDPHRLLIADGINYGMRPSNMIMRLGIAQATRGYQPFTLTHYKAEWVEGSQVFTTPIWPSFFIPRFLYALGKNDVLRSIYSIEHDFTQAYNLDINVGTVSHEARLIVKADGEIIYNRLFESRAGRGEWRTVVYRSEWNIYQNVFDRDYRVVIPAGTRLITLEVTDGDWMTVNDMKFSPVSRNNVSRTGISFSVTPNSIDWGVLIPPIRINSTGGIEADSAVVQNRAWLRETYFRPWEQIIRSGGGVMVGEWGAYNKTPHDVVLRWMEDCLEIFKELDIGWALWNFNDSFGIINSRRTDVRYENYNRQRLDREMLNLLQKYLD